MVETIEEIDEFDWIPDLIQVRVTNPGKHYSTHLEAMIATNVTNAKKFVEKYGYSYFNNKVYKQWVIDNNITSFLTIGMEDTIFFNQNGMNLTTPIKDKTYYIVDKPCYNIYRLIDIETGKDFIIGQEGFEYVK